MITPCRFKFEFFEENVLDFSCSFFLLEEEVKGYDLEC
jgi:hypothetical protein